MILSKGIDLESEIYYLAVENNLRLICPIQASDIPALNEYANSSLSQIKLAMFKLKQLCKLTYLTQFQIFLYLHAIFLKPDVYLELTLKMDFLAAKKEGT